jgi:class 3 adenylate cyclase
MTTSKNIDESNEGSPGRVISAIPVPNNSLRVTVEHIEHPAYLVNYNLEVTWFNELSRPWLGDITRLPDDGRARNVLQFLARGVYGQLARNLTVLNNLHAEAGFDRLNGKSGSTTLPAGGKLLRKSPVLKFDIMLHDQRETEKHYQVFVSFFREGMLFIYIENEQIEGVRESLLQILARRDEVIRDLLKKHLPVHTDVAVLVADLQGSTNICVQLPPEEYFELINQMWGMVEPIFRKYYGTHGKHAGDGMVYYFLPQPDCCYLYNAVLCAQELREEMRKVSLSWQLRKNWGIELRLKTGLHAGKEWLGTFHVDSKVEFTVLGETINQASRLSDFAQGGTIWTSKNLVSKLSPENRRHIRYGIRRRDDQGVENLIESTFSTISIMNEPARQNDKLRDIASLPIAEIIDIIP